MAKLTDPDSLNQGTEIVIDDTTKTIQLIATGNLSGASPGASSGVTGQAVFSFLKEEWKTDADLNKLKFPLKMFSKSDGILRYGWQWEDATTRTLLRDFGWEESVGTEAGDKYACVISLGEHHADTDQSYYQNVTGFDQTAINYDKTGNLNEAFMIDDNSGSNFTGFKKSFLRIYEKIYDEYNLLTAQGYAALEPIVYRLPLSNIMNLMINASDAVVDGNTPYTGMLVDYLSGTVFATANTSPMVVDQVAQDTAGRWFRCTAPGSLDAAGVADYTNNGGTGTYEAYPGERLIGATYYAYNRIIDGNTGTAQQIHNWSQRQLRKTSDINANTGGDGYGTINGNIAIILDNYLGSMYQTNPGVYVDDFDTNDVNSMEFFDITVDEGGVDSDGVPIVSTSRTFPFTSAGNMNFSENLYVETNVDTIYTMYYKHTRTNSVADITITGATGSSAVINSPTIDLLNIVTGQYFELTGFLTNTVNNGIWIATGDGTANTVAADKINGDTVINDALADTITLRQNPYDTPGAIIVDDNSDVDIQGQVDALEIGFDYDYDNNVQGNKAAATDVTVVIMAQGLNASEWIDGEFIISRATGLSFTVTAGDERNYSNA